MPLLTANTTHKHRTFDSAQRSLFSDNAPQPQEPEASGIRVNAGFSVVRTLIPFHNDGNAIYMY